VTAKIVGIAEGVRQGGGVRGVCAVGEAHDIRDGHLFCLQENGGGRPGRRTGSS